MSEFFSAIESGNWRQVALLIERGSIDVNAPIQIDRFHMPPLVFAAMSGEDDIVELLLNAGTRINDCDGIGRTACFVAVEYSHSDVFHRLTARGADICDQRGRSPLSIAAFGANRMLTSALIEAGAPLTDPIVVCQVASLSAGLVAMLLQRHVDINACRSIDGGTACHTAVVRSDDTEVVRALVLRGRVDVNATDHDARTCVYHCANFNHVNSLRFFIEAGADVDVLDARRRSALHRGSWRGHLQCTLLLLAAGADINARDKYGRTPCHFAASQLIADDVRNNCLQALLAVGADFDAPDNSHNTPRQLATHLGVSAPSADELAALRRRIAALRLDFVRSRALEVCIGLRPLDLDALQMCEILVQACGPIAPLIPFHQWWNIATTVKHFRRQDQERI